MTSLLPLLWLLLLSWPIPLLQEQQGTHLVQQQQEHRLPPQDLQPQQLQHQNPKQAQPTPQPKQPLQQLGQQLLPLLPQE